MIASKNRYRRQVYKTGTVMSIGPTAARYLIIILIAIFSVMYLVQSTQGASQIVELRSQETKTDELNKEISTLEVNVSRLKSLQKLNETAAGQGLVPIQGQPETINISNPQ
jgi:cell division protein FtsL